MVKGYKVTNIEMQKLSEAEGLFLLKHGRSQDEGKHAPGKEFQREAARRKKQGVALCFTLFWEIL